jgi:hypothetical protein
MHLVRAIFFRFRERTYTKILTKSAVDGDVLRCDEVAERRVRVVAGEGAVGAGGVAVLLSVRMGSLLSEMLVDIPRD